VLGTRCDSTMRRRGIRRPLGARKISGVDQRGQTDSMKLRVNPHRILVAGENSFVRLGRDGSATPAHWASHWRVFWSQAGPGHVLFLDSELIGGLQIFADSEELARFLQQMIEYFLYEPFADSALRITQAAFQREAAPPCPTTESVAWSDGVVHLRWSQFLDPFSFAAPPGFNGRPLGLHTTFFPARSASLVVSGRGAVGAPWRDARGDQPCTSACLAWCETWYEPSEFGLL